MSSSPKSAAGKVLADANIVTESLVKGIGVNPSESINTTENLTFAVNLIKSDNATASSSGSLISQGYCDITYFDSDYVGVSRSFT